MRNLVEIKVLVARAAAPVALFLSHHLRLKPPVLSIVPIGTPASQSDLTSE